MLIDNVGPWDWSTFENLVVSNSKQVPILEKQEAARHVLSQLSFCVPFSSNIPAISFRSTHSNWILEWLP